MKILIILVALMLISSPVVALESDYSKPFCQGLGGVYNAPIKDSSGKVVAYIDCLTSTTAWEVDFAHKWYESVGQSMYYAALTGKRPGIALIAIEPTDQLLIDKFKFTASYWGWRCYDFSTLH